MTTWYCGVSGTLIELYWARSITLYCRQWSCQRCNAFKVDEYCKKISRIGWLSGAHLFVATLNLRAKELSNFIQKNMKGLYVSIYTQEGPVVISTKTFPGAMRKEKRHFLDKELRALLESPWERGRRISSSSELRNYWKEDKSSSGLFALIPYQVDDEYNKLETDQDKAVWLANQKDIKLYSAGKAFIEKHIPNIPIDSEVIEFNDNEDEIPIENGISISDTPLCS